MFGYVTANWKELSEEEQHRYGSVYCGICRRIKLQASQIARLGLQYDMAFLALLHMSLYEPEETSGKNHCAVHPIKRRPWTDCNAIRYAADMNVALSCFKALDDWNDDAKRSSKLFADQLAPHMAGIQSRWPRQCRAIADCIAALSELEAQQESNPDKPASCFGHLMAELLVMQEDLWSDTLRELGFHLGRFIYLVDAMLDYDRDEKSGSYNPFHSLGKAHWEDYLVLAMARCTNAYEKLPLVQDKALLDNILYSGVWVQYRAKNAEESHHDSGSL